MLKKLLSWMHIRANKLFEARCAGQFVRLIGSRDRDVLGHLQGGDRFNETAISVPPAVVLQSCRLKGVPEAFYWDVRSKLGI